MAVDYDPVKAHEYYEKHKKLKGRNKSRRSTKGWSQEKKEQWDYAKEQLKVEHKGIKQNITENSKAERKDLSERAKDVISNLRNQLKGLSKEQRAVAKERIQALIDNVRGELRSDKEALTERTKGLREQENEAYEQRKDEAYTTIKAMNSKNKKGGKK